MRFRRICFFLPSAHRDGAELSALECMDALKALGVQCHVILPQKGHLITDFKQRQIPYKIIPYKVWIETPAPLWKRVLVTLWNLFITYFATFMIGRWKCDLIITNTINICVGAFVAKLWGLPHVWYIREFGFEDHGWRFHLGDKLSLWIMDRLSVSFLAVSRAVAQKYQASIISSTIHFLYQPIAVDFSSLSRICVNKKQFQLTCIMVGRLQEGKRQEDAIRATGELQDQGIPVQLWVVGGGDPDYSLFLENVVREKNLMDQVSFFGQVDSALPYIQQADVLLLCSRCEAFARVVVEGMKAGKPVIGTKRGGTVEQIKEGFNGFLYEPRNHKELTQKIKYLYEHPEVAKKMGRNGKKWAMKTFTQDRYQKEITRIFDRLPSSPYRKSAN